MIKGIDAVRAGISKIADGSASPRNKGLAKLINGSQEFQGDYLVFQYGLKHFAAEIFYRDKLTAYMQAVKNGRLEDAAGIYRKVPALLRQVFNEYAELDTFALSSAPSEKIKSLKGIKDKISGCISSAVSGIKKLFTSAGSSASNKISLGAETAAPAAEKISNSASSNIPASLQLKKMEENPLLKYVIESYRKDGMSDEKILKFMTARMTGQSSGDRFYRFIGESELNRLVSGEKVTSSRPCHNGIITDVTTNPEYGRINTRGSYRVKFKDKPEFNPYTDGFHRISEKDASNDEFHLSGGYSLDDVEIIEQKASDGSYRAVWRNTKE